LWAKTRQHVCANVTFSKREIDGGRKKFKKSNGGKREREIHSPARSAPWGPTPQTRSPCPPSSPSPPRTRRCPSRRLRPRPRPRWKSPYGANNLNSVSLFSRYTLLFDREAICSSSYARSATPVSQQRSLRPSARGLQYLRGRLQPSNRSHARRRRRERPCPRRGRGTLGLLFCPPVEPTTLPASFFWRLRLRWTTTLFSANRRAATTPVQSGPGNAPCPCAGGCVSRPGPSVPSASRHTTRARCPSNLRGTGARCVSPLLTRQPRENKGKSRPFIFSFYFLSSRGCDEDCAWFVRTHVGRRLWTAFNVGWSRAKALGLL
jgi:hypothetical protein